MCDDIMNLHIFILIDTLVLTKYLNVYIFLIRYNVDMRELRTEQHIRQKEFIIRTFTRYFAKCIVPTCLLRNEVNISVFEQTTIAKLEIICYCRDTIYIN